MHGRKIGILESRLGRELVELVARRGGVPVHAPALSELPDLDAGAISSLISSLEAKPAKLFIFQTGVGTKALFAAADSLALAETLLEHLKSGIVAVRGPKPAAALRARKVRIDYSAGDPFTTRELLLEISAVELKGETAIIQRHGSANLELDRALEARGAQVAEIPVYRWSLPADTAPLLALTAALRRGELDALAVTNAEQIRNLFLVSKDARQLREDLNRILVASIGPVASAALREAGVEVGLEASPPKLGALLAALDSALS